MTLAEEQRERAKALITVAHRTIGPDSPSLPAGPPHPALLPVRLLLSIKSAPFSDKDGHLEFLGGQLEDGEPPHEGLLRELQEEELTGELARLAGRRARPLGNFLAEGSSHLLFHLRISFAEYYRLQWDEEESHGFMLVPKPFLDANRAALTPKTRTLLELMRRRGLDPFEPGLRRRASSR